MMLTQHHPTLIFIFHSREAATRCRDGCMLLTFWQFDMWNEAKDDN